jgi:phage tail-like protein
MGAKIPNPRKQFQFNIIIPGFNPFLAQEVKLPDVDFDIQEHGDTNYDVKTAGKKKIGTLTVSKICPADNPGDTQFRQWGKDIQNTDTGGGQAPSQYKRTIIVEEYANDGLTVVERHILKGCWPNKINGKELNRKGSDNTMQTIEFCVDTES